MALIFCLADLLNNRFCVDFAEWLKQFWLNLSLYARQRPALGTTTASTLSRADAYTKVG